MNKEQKPHGHLNKPRKKAFNRTQQPLMIKALNKLGIEQNFLT